MVLYITFSIFETIDHVFQPRLAVEIRAEVLTLKIIVQNALLFFKVCSMLIHVRDRFLYLR